MTNFLPATILYAANLNNAFANTVTINTDNNLTGNISISGNLRFGGSITQRNAITYGTDSSGNPRTWVGSQYGGWLDWFDNYSVLSSYAIGANNKGVGAAFASRSSDNYVNGGFSVIVHHLNDAYGGGEALYVYGVAANTANSEVVTEIELSNFAPLTIQGPYNIGGTGVTTNLFIGAGGEFVNPGGYKANAITCGLAFVTQGGAANGAVFDKGIIFANSAFNYTRGANTDTAIVLDMAQKQALRWGYGGSDTTGSFIRGDNGGVGQMAIIFNNHGIYFVNAISEAVSATFDPYGDATFGGAFSGTVQGFILAATGTIVAPNLATNNPYSAGQFWVKNGFAHVSGFTDLSSNPFLEADYATTVKLTGTYNPGSGNAGGSLIANSNQILTLPQGSTPSLYQRVLVTNQNPHDEENGLYYVANTGNASWPWVLTRDASMFSGSDFLDSVVAVTGADLMTSNGPAYDIYMCNQSNGASVLVGTTKVNFYKNKTKHHTNMANTATTYQLGISDSNRILTFNNTTATTVNVGNNLFIGFETDIVQLNTGSVTLSANSGVVINTNTGTTLVMSSQWSRGKLFCYSSNAFIFSLYK